MKVKGVSNTRRAVKRKYLITWSLALGEEELAKIASQPAALDKALSYIRSLAEETGLEIYRFITMDELTRHTPTTTGDKISTGIAIVEAGSMEDVGKTIKGWVAGLSYGETPIGNYLAYDIKPLAEIELTRRQ